MTRIALRGTILTPSSEGGLTFVRDGVLAIEGGKIAEIGGTIAGPVLDCRPGLIVPGFIDAHVHFPQTRIIGRATGPLLEWLEQSVFPEEARFREQSYAVEVAREMTDRMLSSGTTTAAIFSSSSALATDVMLDHLAGRGMRAMVGLTLMDQCCPEAVRVPREQAMADSRALVERYHGKSGDRLRFAVTPRFAISCTRELLEDAGRLAEEARLPVQTHVAETLAENEETLRIHPYAASYLEVYQQAGLLTSRTVLAHAIHLSDRDWDRVAETGAAIAHCPDSNFFLGSGRMQLGPARERGIRVGLGSDVAAGRSFSIRRAMASAYDNALAIGQQVTPEELFTLATLGGARVLGWDAVTGTLEPGKDGDVAVFPMARPVATLDEALAALIFDTDRVEAARVFVRGRRVW